MQLFSVVFQSNILDLWLSLCEVIYLNYVTCFMEARCRTYYCPDG